ncbi:MAG TPA: hypothetical protein VFS90_08500 [Pyrinomonadaceae bacterium]|nr:hypothetical protein [Pyrinomonadaceae bacterium]
MSGILLAIGFTYFWILPLIHRRGNFLWGHYRLKDIYLGIPLAVATVCAVMIITVPSRYRRALSLRLITVAVSILLTLAISDVGYAFVVMEVWHPNLWLDQASISRRYSTSDSELGFVRKPGISWQRYVPEVDRMIDYRTDENGFRNPPGKQRADIVFIGDSYTEAATVAVDDTFVRRVGQSTGFSVINLGRGAYGARQEQIVLSRYGLAYKPRIVVWQLFEGNDLIDAEVFSKWKQSPDLMTAPLKDRYFHSSLLNELVANTELRESAAPIATLRYPAGTPTRLKLRHKYNPDQPSTRHLGMTETLAAIEAGQQLCQSRGIQLLVVFVPTMVRAMAPYISFDRVEDQKSYLPERLPKHTDFSGRIAELCARTGCTFIDAFDAFRQASANGNYNLYIPNDEHLDVGGHEVLAHVIEGWVRDENIASQR